MAESSLAAAYNDLTGDVGLFLGYGRGSANGDVAWTTEQQKIVDRAVKGGLRNFYFCGYDWSFLKPMATVTILSGAKLVTLPDDFGGMVDGTVMISSPVDQGWWAMKVGTIGDVYQQETRFSTSTGWPEMICQEPIKGTGTTTGQRFQFHVWPTADQNYSLEFQYFVLPEYLSGAFPYAYGGAMHSETLLASCKAVAELDRDDMMGPQQASFQQKLAASEDMDRRNKPQWIGYNRDMSDRRDRRGSWHDRHQTDQTITFGGTFYGG